MITLMMITSLNLVQQKSCWPDQELASDIIFQPAVSPARSSASVVWHYCNIFSLYYDMWIRFIISYPTENLALLKYYDTLDKRFISTSFGSNASRLLQIKFSLHLHSIVAFLSVFLPVRPLALN